MGWIVFGIILITIIAIAASVSGSDTEQENDGAMFGDSIHWDEPWG